MGTATRRAGYGTMVSVKSFPSPPEADLHIVDLTNREHASFWHDYSLFADADQLPGS